MTTKAKYEAELEKLRHMANEGRDFSIEGDIAFGRQFYITKSAYLDVCLEDARRVIYGRPA